MSRKKIVIVGAGFAGLSCLLGLRKADVDITLIDKNDFFEYIPSLHICLDEPKYVDKIRLSLKKYYGDYFVQDEVVKIDKDLVIGKNGNYPFDYLVVATGSVTNMYNNKSFAQYGLPVKNIADTRAISGRITTAESIAVIGGGYTGVEIASILAEQSNAVVHLIHPKKRLLDTLAPYVGKRAQRFIKMHKGKIYLGRKAVSLTRDHVELDNGKIIDADFVVLSAGVSPCDACLSTTTLTPCLALKKYDNIYLCGDVAKSGKLATAHNAMIEGRHVAKHLLGQLSGKKVVEKQHRDWRILAVALGKMDGVLTFGDKYAFSFPLTGLAKWLVEKRIMFEFKYKIRLPV